MKRLKYVIWLGLLGTLVTPTHGNAQKDLLLTLGYVNNNNQVQYLKAVAKTRIDGKFSFVGGVSLHFYIKADSPQCLLGNAVTNERGEAIVYFTPGVRDEWMASPHQHFIVTSESAMGFSSATGEADVTKARLQIDTAAGRSVIVHLTERHDSSWVPVKGVDVRVAVRRMGGDLNISEAATYSTDSTGSFAADFKLDSLPGDARGDIRLVASVDENDTYGTVSAETSVPWGISNYWVSNYEQRALFARRGHSPYWLELAAYSIIVAVWGTMVYLWILIRKIRRLGRAAV